MNNPFDIAREMARLVDAGKAGDDLVAEMRRKFPRMTAADIQRAKLISVERIEMLEEERLAGAQTFADKWCSGAAEPVIDAVIRQYLKDVKLQPSTETLFPKPDKTKRP
jgi:hypothetical protein